MTFQCFCSCEFETGFDFFYNIDICNICIKFSGFCIPDYRPIQLLNWIKINLCFLPNDALSGFIILCRDNNQIFFLAFFNTIIIQRCFRINKQNCFIVLFHRANSAFDYILCIIKSFICLLVTRIFRNQEIVSAFSCKTDILKTHRIAIIIRRLKIFPKDNVIVRGVQFSTKVLILRIEQLITKLLQIKFKCLFVRWIF